MTTAGLTLNCVIVGGTGCATCIVVACGFVVPPAPVATAEYVVVCVGVSLTLPDNCELVSRVRADEPEVAAIVTDVALVIFQFRVMLCPSLIEVALAEKTRVGVGVEGGVGFWAETPEQEQSPHSAIGAIPNAIQ